MSRKKLLQPSPSCILLTDVTSSRNQFKHENKSRIFQLEMDTWEVFDLNHISDARCTFSPPIQQAQEPETLTATPSRGETQGWKLTLTLMKHKTWYFLFSIQRVWRLRNWIQGFTAELISSVRSHTLLNCSGNRKWKRLSARLHGQQTMDWLPPSTVFVMQK